MAIVIGVFMLLAVVPAIVLATLAAFYVYQGHTFEENTALVVALYGTCVAVGLTLALAPALTLALTLTLTLVLALALTLTLT